MSMQVNNYQGVSQISQKREQVTNIATGNNAEFTDALRFLQQNAEGEDEMVLLPKFGQSMASLTISKNQSPEVNTKASFELEDSATNKYSVLEQTSAQKDWSALEEEEHDFSILDTIGSGLLTAAKIAANVAIGKIF